MPPRRLLLAFPLILALAASACGSTKNAPISAGAGSSTTASTSASTPSTTAAAAATTTTAAGSTATPTVATASTGIGMVLVNSAGRTLYHFDHDTATTFGCSSSCLTAWPPLTVSGANPVAGTGVTGTLGMRARPDGTQQVTWNGMPLYQFAADQAPGDTKGDGVGGLWHAAKLSAGAGAGTGSTTTAAYGGSNYP